MTGQRNRLTAREFFVWLALGSLVALFAVAVLRSCDANAAAVLLPLLRVELLDEAGHRLDCWFADATHASAFAAAQEAARPGSTARLTELPAHDSFVTPGDAL
jgi:hypothetical protein